LRAAATIGPLTERVEQLSRHLEAARSDGAVSTAPVERAVTRLAERLEKIESHDRPRERERRWRLFGG